MGANQSQGAEDDFLDGYCRPEVRHPPLSRDGQGRSLQQHQQYQQNNKKARAKPSSPQRPRAVHVTNTTVTLHWAPPRHVVGTAILAYTVEVSSSQDRSWRVLTKSCQGINYEARYLQPSVEYIFRVRAENIYGVGKPSVPSETITTKEYDIDTDLSIGMSQPSAQSLETHNRAESHNTACDQDQEKSKTSTLQRRHSFNVHLEGRVSSILNNSNAGSAPVSTLQRNRAGSQRSERSENRTQALSRSTLTRTSLSSSRKVSLPILLPGTGTHSLNRLRESRNSLKSNTAENSITSNARDPTRSKLRGSRSSLGSSLSDVTSSATTSEEGKQRDSRGSFRSSSSDVTLSNSRDGCSTDTSRDPSLCECSTGHCGDVSCINNNNNNNINDNDNKFTQSCNLNYPSENEHQMKLNSRDLTDSKPVNEVDEISQLKQNLKNLDLELTEEKLAFHDNYLKMAGTGMCQTDAQRNYYNSLENPWERDSSVESQRIMAAPFCDDIKMALCAKSMREDDSSSGNNFGDFRHGSAANQSFDEEQEGGDFRTLQRILQSSSMLVRGSRSAASDIVGVVMEDDGHAHVMRRGGPLSTIVDEEEEDPVRVTSL